MLRNIIVLAVIAFLVVAGVFAQTTSPRLEANKKLVLDFWRVVIEAQNAGAAKEFLVEDYIQHNPLVPTGRDGFLKCFKQKWKSPKPINKELRELPVKIIAENDLVMLMWRIKRSEPMDKSKEYEAFWFDVFCYVPPT